MSKLGLNVGSGQRPFTSTPEVKWINVDTVARTDQPLDLLCDGAHLPAFYDANVDYFVLHHVLEHFGLGEGASLIKEAHRVLKPGGSLLLFIPDIRALATRWLRGEITDYIFMVNMMGAYMGNEEDRHRWHYTVDSLPKFLYDCANWSRLQMFDWRDISGATPARDWWILEVEGIK